MPVVVGTSSIARVSVVDAGHERASFHCYGLALTDANWVAQQALWTTLKAKIVAVINGVVRQTSYGNIVTEAWSYPTNGAARELALRIRSKDTTTQQKFSYKIPTVNPTIPVYDANEDARDIVLLTSPTAITDLIAAFNAFAVSPITGNTLVLTGLSVSRGGK